jgi:translation initiation factor IF-1
MLLIEIVNDGTGTEEVGNYRYEVKVNKKVIAKGKVDGHWRKNAWWLLVLQIALGHTNDVSWK